MAGYEDESLESTTPPPPEVEAPPPRLSTPLPRSPPPPASNETPPLVDPRDSTGKPGTGGAASHVPLASQLLLLLPLFAFL